MSNRVYMYNLGRNKTNPSPASIKVKWKKNASMVLLASEWEPPYCFVIILTLTSLFPDILNEYYLEVLFDSFIMISFVSYQLLLSRQRNPSKIHRALPLSLPSKLHSKSSGLSTDVPLLVAPHGILFVFRWSALFSFLRRPTYCNNSNHGYRTIYLSKNCAS